MKQERRRVIYHGSGIIERRKKKSQPIDIIPENAPYMDDSHITVRSIADESLSEDDVEQEELSKLSKKRTRNDKEGAPDASGSGPTKNDSAPETESHKKHYQKKPRKKTSDVWSCFFNELESSRVFVIESGYIRVRHILGPTR